jgi:hypothetical protein
VATLQAKRQATNFVTDRKGKSAATVVHVVSFARVNRSKCVATVLFSTRWPSPCGQAARSCVDVASGISSLAHQARCCCACTPQVWSRRRSPTQAKCARDEAKSTLVCSFDRDATLTVTRTSHPHDLTHNWASIRDAASWDMYTREMCQWPLCTATAAHEGVQPARPAAI